MMHRALPWLLPVALVACTPDSKSVGAGESSTAEGSGGGTDDSSGSQGSQSSSMSSVGSTADTTQGTSSEPTISGTATSTSPTTGPDTGSGTDTEDTTGVPGECDIVEVVNDAAVGKMEPDDCGFILLADPLDAWEAAQQCVLTHYNTGLAFTLVAEQQGIDSEVHIGFAGAQGVAYAASRFFSDANGIMPGTLITGGPCNIEVVGDCTVAQGNLCLTCVESPDPVTVCETP